MRLLVRKVAAHHRLAHLKIPHLAGEDLEAVSDHDEGAELAEVVVDVEVVVAELDL